MKTVLGIIAVSIIAIALGLLLTPKTAMEKRTDLPWQIVANGDGTSKVFGLTLGRSTLADAMHKIKEQPEITMFVSPEGEKVVEAYFEQVKLGNVRAKMVVAAALSKQQLEQIYERGLRISKSSGGGRKVTLHPDDIIVVNQTAIGSITYLPRTNLDTEVITRLFGTPAKRIRERENNVVHWLYPEKGLDIALSPDKKEVLQYIAPAQFEQLSSPLMQSGTLLE
ncbi:MAG TPA: hypothetical protein ENK38_01460 [Gammaproteobacteria bacterium]|nr:hypothetical protein [Gammaproteobacteria bacterium]